MAVKTRRVPTFLTPSPNNMPEQKCCQKCIRNCFSVGKKLDCLCHTSKPAEKKKCEHKRKVSLKNGVFCEDCPYSTPKQEDKKCEKCSGDSECICHNRGNGEWCNNCSTPRQELVDTWEEEFDAMIDEIDELDYDEIKKYLASDKNKLFINLIYPENPCELDSEKIKDFIRTLKTQWENQSYQRGIQEAVEKIKELRKLHNNCGWGFAANEYNDKMDEIIQSLKSSK